MTIPSTFLKKVFFILLLCNSCHLVNATILSQSTTIDSLSQYSYIDLKKLSNKYYYTNVALAELYAKEILNRGIKNNDENEQINGYYQLGIVNVIKGDHANAILLFDNGIGISEKNNNQSELLKLYLNQGNNYLFIDNYKKALYYYEKTIPIAKTLKKEEYEIISYLNIALIKKDIGQFEEALVIERENIKRAAKVSTLSKRTAVSLFINLSGTLLNLKENDSAIYYAKKGLELSSKAGDREGTSYLYNITGCAYQNKKEDPIAIRFFNKSLTIIETLKNNKRIAATHYLLAKSHATLNSSEEALDHLKKAEKAIVDLENYHSEELLGMYKLFAEIYSNQNKKELANHYYQKYINADSLKDTSKTAVIGDLYYKDIKEKQQQLQKVSKQKYSLKFFLGTGILSLMIALFVLTKYVKKSKKYKNRFEVLYQNTLKSAKAITNRSAYKINDEKAREILEKLKKTEAKEYFLKSDFSLHTLAKKLKTNPSYLSRVINTCKQKQFSEYTNELRISYAINRLKSDPKFRAYSILHISKELGYKSQDSFSKHFKKRTGAYPSSYIANIKKIQSS